MIESNNPKEKNLFGLIDLCLDLKDIIDREIDVIEVCVGGWEWGGIHKESVQE